MFLTSSLEFFMVFYFLSASVPLTGFQRIKTTCVLHLLGLLAGEDPLGLFPCKASCLSEATGGMGRGGIPKMVSSCHQQARIMS